MMHSCLKSFYPPTGVSTAIEARFTSIKDTNLIVTRANYLDIYTLHQQQQNDKPHLTLVRSFELFGNIICVKAVTFAGDERDSLLLSFEEEAKVSVVSWDQEKCDLKTASLHYFEDNYLKEGRTNFTFPLEIKLDPHRRCATLVIYDTKLVILPFRQQGSILDDASFGKSNGSHLSEFESLFHSSSSSVSSGSHLKMDGRKELPVKRQIIVDLKELGIRNVKDFCFLHGYTEPTILFLYELEPTWSGRLSVKRNTCAVAAISLDLSRESYPEVWRVTHLPHDCYKLIPIKESVGGGAIVIAHNSLLHVNHKAHYGLSLNDFAEADPELAIVFEMASFSLFMECGAFTFLTDSHIMLSLQNGDLYVLQLFNAGGSIRKLILSRSKTSVPASCMCTLNDNLFYMGSKLGNSLLIQFVEENKKLLDSEFEPSRKKRKGENGDVVKAESIIQTDDDFLSALDDISHTPQNSTEQFLVSTESMEDRVSYNLIVTDLFTNIGPISSMDVVDTTVKLSAYTSRKNAVNNNLEVVLCSGYSKNGCICILQRNLKPRVNLETTLDFDCKQMWTVKHNTGGPDAEFDSYLIFSANDGTKILQSREALSEITKSEEVQFITTENTLKAGNMLRHTRVVQICLKTVRYLNGTTKIHDIPFEKEIRSATIKDRYVLLHFKDGTVSIFRATPQKLDLVKSIAMNKKNAKFGKITAATLYINESVNNKNMFEMTESDAPTEIFCPVAWSSGVFEIYTVPECEPVFTFLQFGDFYRTVFDQSSSEIKDFKESDTHVRYPYVTEMMFRSVGNKHDPPHLIVSLSDGSIFAYRTFYHKPRNADPARLSNLRFTKVRNDELIQRRDHSNQEVDEYEKLDVSNTDNIFGHKGIRIPRFVSFDNINNLGGIFACGEKPLWFLSERGDLRIHPMQHELCSVDSFTSFHNKGCRNGFIYYLKRGSVCKMAQLNQDPSMKYTTHWPTRKIPLLSTPHHVAYHQEAQTCVVATSTYVRAQMVEDQDEIPEEGRYPLPMERQYMLRLFSATSWIEMDKYDLEPHEQVLSVKQVFLAREEVNSDDEDEGIGVDDEPPIDVRDKDMIPFIAVGTGYTEGEESLCRGRIIIFDMEPRLDGGANQYALKVIASKELKGPVSQVTQLEGYIAVCMGPKIYVYYLDSRAKQLMVTSFYDTQFYITSMISIKSFLTYCDIYRGAHFLRWKEKGHRLSLMARDFKECHTVASEFIVNDDSLGLIVTDMNKNIQIFAYAPLKDKKALLPCADFHVGALINSMVRMKSRDIQYDDNARRRGDFRTDVHKQFVMYSTLDGSLGYIAPIAEDMYRRLYALTTKMYTQLEHSAGLHPKAYRLFKPMHSVEHNHQKNVIDGQLLWRFTHLDTKMQKALADQIGTTVHQILRNIKYLHQSTLFF